jgi:hypothetical protein
MPSDFITDLIDHKERVVKYMHTSADILYDHVMPVSVDPAAKDTLFEIIVLAADYQQRGMAPFASLRMEGQLRDVAANTMAFFSCKEAYDGGWLRYAIFDLFQRAAVHDNSKFGPEEFDLFDQAFPVLAKHAYGSDGYKAGLTLLGPALKHHYEVNDHHPEFFSNGITDMHCVQLMEMCCDWLAASERSQRDIMEGLEINRKRFNIDDQLFPVLKNTIVTLKEA